MKLARRRGLIFGLKSKFIVPNDSKDEKGKVKKPREIRKWTMMRDYIKAKLIADHDISWDSVEASGAGLTAEIIASLKCMETGVPAAGDLFEKLIGRQEGLAADMVKYLETNQVAQWGPGAVYKTQNSARPELGAFFLPKQFKAIRESPKR
eukprot:6760806-Pyramimonas_sp.AAC.1